MQLSGTHLLLHLLHLQKLELHASSSEQQQEQQQTAAAAASM